MERLGHLAERAVVVGIPVALLAYSSVALVGFHWWFSGVSAPVVAALLAWRHPRARFAAYILLSLVIVRTARLGVWPLLAAAVVALLVLQTPAALRAWPRVTARWRRRASRTRMASP